MTSTSRRAVPSYIFRLSHEPVTGDMRITLVTMGKKKQNLETVLERREEREEREEEKEKEESWRA